jgi:hypothetical protein
VEIVNPEVTAFLRAADVAGVKLPADIAEARERMDKVDEALASLPALESVPHPAKLMAQGASLEEAKAESARQKEEALAQADSRRIALDAQSRVRRELNRLVAEQRDELIVSLRPTVNALIQECRPHAQTLAGYHPEFDERALLRNATPAELKAWQAAAELEKKFGVLIAAWRAAFKASRRRPGGFDVREVGEEQKFWEAPALVDSAYLNGTRRNRQGGQAAIQPNLLGVASEPAEAGFRLATIGDLAGIYAARLQAQAQEAKDNLPWRRRGMRAI